MKDCLDMGNCITMHIHVISSFNNMWLRLIEKHVLSSAIVKIRVISCLYTQP